MANPENFIKFGICPVCSSTGLDGETGERLTGYYIKLRANGEYMCTICWVNQHHEDKPADDALVQADIEYQDFSNGIGMRKL